MNLKGAGSEDRKKMIAVGGFVVIAGAVLYFELSGGSAPAPVAPPAVVTAPAASNEGTTTGPAAKWMGTTSAALDPTLHMGAMLVSESVEYSGSGRNIFSANTAPPPVAIQKPIAPARPVPVAPVVPCPPNCPPPPPPPPIQLKFFGVADRGGRRQALLLHDDDVWVASPGDVVMRRYRVISIADKTIEVEDMQNNNKQTLPLLTN
jgi:hypothetical protein